MNKVTCAGAAGALLVFGLMPGLMAGSARGSDLGPDGRIHFAPDALLTVDFEDPTRLATVLRKVAMAPGNKSWSYQALQPADVMPLLLTGADALEGQSGLHLVATGLLGYAVVDSTVFTTAATGRVSVSFWGRAEGIEPFLAVTYGNEVDLPVTKQWAWARIPAVRTGRETSDGWVEYSTGAIDGSVLDRPIHDLFVTARVPTAGDTALLSTTAALYPTDAITIDAIEMRPEPGAPASGTCNGIDLDANCGPSGECVFGRCVDGAVSWHPAPSMSMQLEVVQRVVHWATHFLGDRSATVRASDSWVAATLALASNGASARSFWGGLSGQLVALRDSHTHFGAPYGGINTPFAVRPGSGSGPLDVCFGPTLDDLGNGQLAYVVWARGTGAAAALEIGDVVTAIDGMDPKSWVETVLPRYVGSLPVDPSADWGPSSRDLASLVAAHAGTLTVTRCSGGSCAAQPVIDVPGLSLAALSNGAYANGTLTCSPRFTDTVAGSRTDALGGELFISAALDAQTVAMEFDGFQPTDATTWEGQVQAAFALPHAHVLVDAREGFGGLNELGDYLMQRFRGTGAPAVLVLAARGTFSAPDDPSLFSFDWTTCAGSNRPMACDTADIYIYQPSLATPPGLNSKVAWLDTDDVSNNDMVPRLLEGRANLRIFAPFPSYGALGSDVAIPPLQPNWHAGTIAASDARYATTIALAEANPTCESGTGVSPDQVATQTLSDVLAGHDTIVTAATTWLNQ